VWNTRFVPERALLSRPPTDAATGNGSARAVRRHRPLPNGRAVAGGLLVAVAALGLFASWRAATAPPTTEYVVAARTLAVGSILRRGDLSTVRLHLPAAQRRQAFTSPAALVGTQVLGPLARGELVQASDLAAGGGEGRRQLSFPIDASRALDGEIARGEHVDVLATYGGGGADSWTAVIADRVLVADVGASGSSLGSARTLTLTLSLDDPDEVLAVTHAARAGTITIVRAGDGEIADTYRPTPPDRR
jgi:Flp pilus assembly protein CpaB